MKLWQEIVGEAWIRSPSCSYRMPGAEELPSFSGVIWQLMHFHLKVSAEAKWGKRFDHLRHRNPPCETSASHYGASGE